MIRLSRTVRFAVNPVEAPPQPVRNGFAGWPAARGLARQYELVVHAAGTVDQRIGFFINIQDIDRIVREHAIPLIERACRERPATEPVELMGALVAGMQGHFRGALESVAWMVTPTHSIEMEAKRMDSVVIRQRFEFAASHRLYSPALSDEENRRLYGKCSSPNGHGHNYVVEPGVRVRLDPRGRPTFTLDDLERLTGETVIARFDHKHLNLDAREFAQDGGVLPSVENIARVCFDLLAPGVRAAGADLEAVTVWETGKTSATYPA